MKAVIQRAWRGEESLGIVFWGYNIVLPLTIWLLLSALKASLILFIPVALAAIIIFAWALVSLWRCAPNTTNKNLSFAARAFIGFAFVLLVWIVSTNLRKKPVPDMSLQQITAPATITPSDKCIKTMSDFANKRQVNADAYINANRAFLDKCIAYYTTNPTAL